MENKKTLTKGNVIVEDIKVGDIHYEFEYGVGFKCMVLTQPTRDDDGYWTWKSEGINNGKIVEYGVREGMSHYSPKLYDYPAYEVNEWV